MKKNISVKRTLLLVLLITLIIMIIYVIKFYRLSFKDSQPNDWNNFSSFFESSLNPILTIINIVIFIKLTLIVQKANENKSWVDKTESLVFNFIESLFDLASYLRQISADTAKEKLDNYKISEIKTIVDVKNRQIFRDQLALKLFAESNLFINCRTREEVIKQSSRIIDSMNSFLSQSDGELPENKSSLMKEKYIEFENEMKTFIEVAKKFSDEIYNI
ncbi:hypothetical protein [Flavobacterium sp.]|uniref:hypothetical protein n=1 Tax=Flavobacterium sp. TaxID=239 RepID=UPI00261F84BE|nr:hypothetical protein [Flavobacterium sp.]MDD2986969.1 hypothetical protein [Flavobacterium sp.]